MSYRNLGKAVGPPQVYSARNILFVSHAILLLHRLICCITWVASNLPKYALAKLGFFLLGLRASKSLGLPQSLSFRAATKTKNPNLANGGFTREERGRHEDEEWQKIPQLERSSVVGRGGAARQQQQRFWGSHV